MKGREGRDASAADFAPRAPDRMSNCEQLQEDLFGGPLRASGERKVLHDRHGGVAGAISAHAAFAVPMVGGLRVTGKQGL